MDNIPRFFFYATGVLLVSASIILLSSEFLVKITAPGITGILFLLGYGLVYMNLVFVTSRRFMRRLQGSSPTPFIFALLIAFPPVVWVSIYDAGIQQACWLFILTIIFGCAIGAFFGHKAGLKAQIKFQEELKKYLEHDERTPGDLKRPHDNLNQN